MNVKSTTLIFGCLAAGCASAGKQAEPNPVPPPAAEATGRTFEEANGRILLEAENYSAIGHRQSWQHVPGAGGKGTAMKVLEEGPWNRHLRYDITFATPGTYRLWALARKNPEAGQWVGNDAKIFFYPAGAEQHVWSGRVLFEIGMREQRDFLWLDWAKDKAKEAAGVTPVANVVVERPGLHHLYLVGGAGEEWGWEVDQLALVKDNTNPPAGDRPE